MNIKKLKYFNIKHNSDVEYLYNNFHPNQDLLALFYAYQLHDHIQWLCKVHSSAWNAIHCNNTGTIVH